MATRTEWIESSDACSRLRDEWDDLLAADPSATPFQTPEWVQLWHRHLAPGSSLKLLTLRDGRDLVALYPLAFSRGAWSVLKPAGVGPSDYLAPIIRAETPWAAELLADFLFEKSGADLVDLHQVPARSPLSLALPGQPARQAECLRVALPSTYDAYVKSLSKSLRYDVRRLDKLDATRYRFERVESPDVFFSLHEARWRKRGLPGAFVGRLKRFHREWCALAASRGWLRMTLLWDGDLPIGALYGMAYGPRTYFYQSGFAPASGNVSPGTLLVAQTIRGSITEGRLVFDMMRGAEEYKRRWKPTVEDANLRFLMPTTALGHVAQAWTQRAMRVEARVRARLEGKGLFA